MSTYSGPFGPALDFPGGAAIGVARHVVVGETVEDAMRVARPAYKSWHMSLTKLFRENGVEGPKFARGTLDTVEGSIAAGSDIVGDPATVCAEIERQIAALGINYMICQFYFGDMEHADAMRSVELSEPRSCPGSSRRNPARDLRLGAATGDVRSDRRCLR